MRGTCADEDPAGMPVNCDYPLCRTQQLLLCVALAMTRQITYECYVKREPLKEMAMNEFEDKIRQITDVKRLVSETI